MSFDSTDSKNIILNHLTSLGVKRRLPIKQPSWDPAHARELGVKASKALGRRVTPNLAILDSATGRCHVFEWALKWRTGKEAAEEVRAMLENGGAGREVHLYFTMPAKKDFSATQGQIEAVWTLTTLPGVQWLALDWPDQVKAIRPELVRLMVGTAEHMPEINLDAVLDAEEEAVSESPHEDEAAARPKSWRDLAKRPLFWVLVLAFLMQLLRLLR
ncbi:MAG: hypothetical protein HYT87_08545 [Nitrospirae bacterium]|nr:hypothetical protein [Nitrospirota bacterium]